MSVAPFTLRALPLLVRVGLSGIVAALALGLWASLEHLRTHHEQRDGAPGVSRVDLLGAYHGVSVPAPLAAALERGHPEELPAADRAALLAWLRGPKLSERYDDPDLGADAPAERIARGCLSCHARNAAGAAGAGAGANSANRTNGANGASRASGAVGGELVPLDYWDDVAKLAVPQELVATPRAILVTSTHTHALALGTLCAIVSALAWCTRFGRWREGLLAAMGVGLAADLASWWLVRESAGWLWLLIGAGALYALSTALALLLVLAELWLPRRE